MAYATKLVPTFDHFTKAFDDMQIITNSFIKPNEHHLITFSTFSSCFIRKPVPQEHCFDHRADGYISYEYSSVTDSELQCYEAGTHGCMHGTVWPVFSVLCGRGNFYYSHPTNIKYFSSKHNSSRESTLPTLLELYLRIVFYLHHNSVTLLFLL